MDCSTPLGRWDSACHRVGRRDRAGWQRDGAVIAMEGEAAVGKIGTDASLWAVCGEAGH
jgi:hypothetical protein